MTVDPSRSARRTRRTEQLASNNLLPFPDPERLGLPFAVGTHVEMAGVDPAYLTVEAFPDVDESVSVVDGDSVAGPVVLPPCVSDEPIMWGS